MNYITKVKLNNQLQILLKLVAVLFISFFAATNAYALKCAQSGTGSTSFTENIGSIKVPQNMADGTVIWRSENRTMSVQCWKDRGLNGGPDAQAENAFYYINPDNESLGNGIALGIIANGADYDFASGPRVQVPNVTVPYYNQSESNCKASSSVTFTINYSLYIKKKGTPGVGPYFFYRMSLGVFQIDGSGGLNTTAGGNFKYYVSGLNSIYFIGCNASISVRPSTINFGNIVTPTPGSTGPAANANFVVNAMRSCDSPFVLTALYASAADKSDNSTLNLGNGLAMKVKNVTANRYIQYAGVESFADLTSSNSVDTPFTAELSWNGATPTQGAFSTAITITVFYN